MNVVSVNISLTKGTTKCAVSSVVVDEFGIQQDAHAGSWHRQISLLAWEVVENFAKETGLKFDYGDFAENITTTGIDLQQLKPCDVLRIGLVELEVTQCGKECHGQGCSVYDRTGRCVMPIHGVFCRVLTCGQIKVGDEIELLCK